jgi:hypothetical protein
MEDLPEAGNLLRGRAMGIGIGRAVDVVGTSSRCWILTATASTLDTSLTPGSGTLDAANAVGTSSRKPVDAVRASARRVRSGMICIFSNYRLRIKKIQYHASLVKYRFLRSYSVKSRIYVVFHEFYDHLTCLYLCLGDLGLIA